MADTTVFDLLYDEYFPFRLYADYMLGRSPKELAEDFGLSENWVAERIEAVRLCVEKQVRLNLVKSVRASRPFIGTRATGSLPQVHRV
ncbi:MAG TPA: hypothetical protein VLJ11_00465 [Bryobacteraceae bacterium]|nr:hypothetical protein [Bryobacteraceae bacterium]